MVALGTELLAQSVSSSQESKPMLYPSHVLDDKS